METSTHDATADFYTALNDPSRWAIKQGVPIFKAHERVDPATGKLIKVDLTKLYRIADNMQKLERQGGVPVRMTLGHTEPGKPETEQPPVSGYYRNARVAAFGPKGEPAVVVDEWLDPQYLAQRKNFPYRSAEYYDDTEQITGVALLTRDPYLDLGVVAYTRAGRNAVHYQRTSERATPTRYHFTLTGEDSMFPEGQQPNPNGTPLPGQQAPIPTVPQPTPTGYANPVQPVYQQFAPQGPPQQVFTAPTVPNPGQSTLYPNVAPGTPYTGTWPGPAHQRANIGHSHASGGAIYDSRQQGRGQRPGRYATEPPEEDAGGGGSPPPGGGGGDKLQVVRDCLMEAVEALSDMIGGGGPGGPETGPPTSPFPEGPEGPDESLGRYGAAPPRSQRPYQPNFRYSRQSAGPRPQQQRPNQPPTSGTPSMQRTISGYPVGYQLELSRMQAQVRQANEALRILYYEREQADNEWCLAEIRRLADAGYDVGEMELHELKSRPREQRTAYLNNIAAKYSRIGTEPLPPILGDPTPGQADGPQQRGPLTREEMEQALKMTAGNPDPNAFSQAVNYIRSGQQATNYNRLPPNFQGPQQQQLYGPEANVQLGYDPYPEPSVNGY